jgi:multiple sugar transport system substrate-binding protein
MIKKLTRREMLGLSGSLAAGSLLAGCTPAPSPEPVAEPGESAAEPVTVVVMVPREDLTEDQVAQFAASERGCEVEVVDWNLSRLFATYAAGDPPDLFLCEARDVGQYLARNLLYDLTPYFEASSVLAIGDLASVNDYFRATGPLEVGEGPRYGMCTQWSPEFTLFAYEKAFEDAGVALPGETTVLTYREIRDLAGQLAGVGVTFGYGYRADRIETVWENALAEMGLSLYSDDLAAIVLTDAEETRAVLEYTYALAAENLVPNPQNPGSGRIGDDFGQGQVALVQLGYWFAAAAESDVTAGEVTMLPAPTWSGVRRNPPVTLAGTGMAAATAVPDAAWTVFEWYHGGEPARERTRSGSGVPALESLYGSMPGETPFQQQVQRVLAEELALETGLLRVHPALDEGAIARIWEENLEGSLRGEITFDELLANVEAAVNAAIQANAGSI